MDVEGHWGKQRLVDGTIAEVLMDYRISGAVVLFNSLNSRDKEVVSCLPRN